MGAYNRTSGPAARPPKIYLPRPVPAAGVEEGAGEEEGVATGVDDEAGLEARLYLTINDNVIKITDVNEEPQ